MENWNSICQESEKMPTYMRRPVVMKKLWFDASGQKQQAIKEFNVKYSLSHETVAYFRFMQTMQSKTSNWDGYCFSLW